MFSLKPSLTIRLFAAAFLLLGGVLIAYGAWLVTQHSNEAVSWILSGCGALFFVAGLILLLIPKRIDFNLKDGSMTHRWLGLRQRRPLKDILAVQLISGGWHTVRNQNGGAQTYFTYQVNLIVDDERRPRLNLTNQSHWESSWQCGQQLAEFLGVPFIDQASEKDKS